MAFHTDHNYYQFAFILLDLHVSSDQRLVIIALPNCSLRILSSTSFISIRGQCIQMKRAFPNHFKIQIKTKILPFLTIHSLLAALDSPEMTPEPLRKQNAKSQSKCPKPSSQEDVTTGECAKWPRRTEGILSLSTRVRLRRKCNPCLCLMRRSSSELIYEQMSPVFPQEALESIQN